MAIFSGLPLLLIALSGCIIIIILLRRGGGWLRGVERGGVSSLGQQKFFGEIDI